MSTDPARRRHTVSTWIPSGTLRPRRRPAPARARRPRQRAAAFDVVLERVARGRPERSWCSPGCAASARPCCSTRCAARPSQRAWGTGKIEARPDQSLRLPLAAGAARGGPRARPPAPRPRARRRGRSACSRRSRCATPLPDAQGRDRWQPADRRARRAGAAPTPATSRSTWSSCSPTSAGLAADLGVGHRALHRRDAGPRRRRRLARSARACHEISQQGAPLIVVGAGLPHLPAVLVGAASPTPSGCSATSRIDRLAARGGRPRADRARRATRTSTYEPRRARRALRR